MEKKAINDGGCAFPPAMGFDLAGREHHGENGMSLRDWFAGMAMQVYAEKGKAKRESQIPLMATAISEMAYVLADAMIAAREPQP